MVQLDHKSQSLMAYLNKLNINFTIDSDFDSYISLSMRLYNLSRS
jgi:hypothetical protein